MTEQISVVVAEVKETYKRQIFWSNSSFYQQLSLSARILQLRLTAAMKNIILFFVFTAISLGLTKSNKPMLPTRIPATSLEPSDTACSSKSHIDEEVRKIKNRLDTLLRPCDCGGPGWEKIAFYNFSQQECPPDFTRSYGIYNNTSCRATNFRACECQQRLSYSFSSSLPLPLEGRSYSSVCGRVRGHGDGHGLAFYSTIACGYTLEQSYVHGVSLTHGPAGRRTHIWTFAASWADGDPDTYYT